MALHSVAEKKKTNAELGKWDVLPSLDTGLYGSGQANEPL